MTREEAKKRLEVWLICGECPEDKQCYDSYLHSTCEYTDYCDEVSLTDAVKVAISALENKGEWIPVSERLPEDGVEVLCTVREMCDFPDDNEYDVPLTFIAQGHYINHEQKIFRGWYIKVRPDCSMGTDKVIAWMPLPKQYKSEAES